MGDVDIELVERVAAEILEILLHLHFDIVPREVGAELVAIGAEIVGSTNSSTTPPRPSSRSPSAKARASARSG